MSPLPTASAYVNAGKARSIHFESQYCIGVALALHSMEQALKKAWMVSGELSPSSAGPGNLREPKGLDGCAVAKTRYQCYHLPG